MTVLLWLLLFVFIATSIAAFYYKGIRKMVGVVCFAMGTLLCITIVFMIPGLLLMAWGLVFLLLSR